MNILIKPSHLKGEIAAISSKSYVHRLLFCAAVADAPTIIHVNGISDDIMATIRVLTTLGAQITLENDIIRVVPMTEAAQNVTLNCGECGATSRFVLPFAAALCDSFTVVGEGSILGRPFGELSAVMAKNSCQIRGNYLPILVKNRLNSGVFEIKGDISSQYITGLLLALPLLDGECEIRLTTPLKSAGYVDMTLAIMAKYGVHIKRQGSSFFTKPSPFVSPKEVYAEGDWSNAAFWLCANKIGGEIAVTGLDDSSTQADKAVVEILKSLPTEIDADHIPDLIMAVAAAAVHTQGKTIIRNAARLKLKESDRIATLGEVIRVFGGEWQYDDGSLVITGKTSGNRQKIIDSHNDHRVAMLVAILAAVGDDEVLLTNAQTVNKSYPTFFSDFERLGGNINVI